MYFKNVFDLKNIKLIFFLIFSKSFEMLILKILYFNIFKKK